MGTKLTFLLCTTQKLDEIYEIINNMQILYNENHKIVIPQRWEPNEMILMISPAYGLRRVSRPQHREGKSNGLALLQK